ncbi:Holliday junction branch migration protein RuvA [Spirulina sp. CS-785/01]|uniref:Holliday junction branch migration protein RuvA n=1 Tax=Spirulina sp. CS-785/01 TaxID=3021716 RepID=UPI00232A834C|nr:Holliday junction branch migration protein RuvA [Spirulina sp. CS-785/01]MDB9312688.1 Holliday junction branch migration protein RuvA [Spirulina sp. CS-785/01]
MISYLRGIAIAIFKNLSNRFLLTLEVQGVGYEIQIPSRFVRQITLNEEVQVFTHQQVRDDFIILYGFSTAPERDLFRHLISVSGIGAQLAIVLIDTLGLTDLVQAIVTGNTKLLVKAPGVGKKTAERISLELKTKLAQWRQEAGVPTVSSPVAPSPQVQEDVEMTLLALGYEFEEIQQALSALSQDNLMLKNTSPEDWIRNAISWLSDNG